MFLYATAALCGAAVMVVEILGAKLLAPHLGTSHFVWTAQIAVTLVALAAGYYVGGRMADRRPGLRPLFVGILLAAIYLVGSVAAARAVTDWSMRFALPTAALLSSSFLFLPPLALLATCVPFLIRSLAGSLDGVAGTVGRLSAISTAGSLAGTLLVGYALIPYLPNSRIMYLTAAALMTCSVAYFIGWERRRSPGATGLALMIAAGAGLFGLRASAAPPWQGTRMRELHRSNSNFGELQVLESLDGKYRSYLNDLLVQNQYDATTHQSINAFTYVLQRLAHAYVANPRRVLCIGMGVGVVPMAFAAEGAQVDVVEINPAVVPLATRYFDFRAERVSLSIDDGRHALRTAQAGTYDAVILDAFLGESSPAHLMTREAFEDVARVLAPGGALVINSFGDLQPGQDFLPASLAKTLQAVFPSVRVHHIGSGNVYFVASRLASLPEPVPGTFDDVHPGARVWVWRSMGNGMKSPFEGGMVLTDDYNPTEVREAPRRENMRRTLVHQQRLD